MEPVSSLTEDRGTARSRVIVQLLVLVAGLSALSWEVLWQLKASLALGVSAMGTAITLAALMGGMTVGALGAGRLLRGRTVRRPVRLYGLLEATIGLSGLLLGPAFTLLERVDAAVFRAWPHAAPLVHLAGIVVILGPPTLAMGATVPVFGLVARQFRTSIARLYGMNTFGAATGVLLMAFVVLPALGMFRSGLTIAAINFLVLAGAWLLPEGNAGVAVRDERREEGPRLLSLPWTAAVVFVTGLATFGLEVAWFRAMRAAFRSTTHSFAIMLAAVLIALAVGARVAERLPRNRSSLGRVLVLGGALALLATPLVERMDLLTTWRALYFVYVLPYRFLISLVVIGPGILFLGIALPLLLDVQRTPRDWGVVYGVNTVGAVVGSIGAAWLLLPGMGFARTAWLIGALVAVTGVLVLPRPRQRTVAVVAAALPLLVAFVGESGVGERRFVGRIRYDSYELLDYREGPDASVAVVESGAGSRVLVIDGFQAASSDLDTDAYAYMAWMGHLPMLLHPDPGRALVICFGTGQTANAVRREDPDALDVVDLNAAVFDMATYFQANEGILDDPRTRSVVMDGRAWLRRTDERYDAITLEPMPPNFAGVNALYSREFYALAKERLTPDGVIAQWVPFHLLTPEMSTSIAATFLDVFPDSVMWVDPSSGTGILVGRTAPAGGPALTEDWPGLETRPGGRGLTAEQVRSSVALDQHALRAYASAGRVVTDDNQLLAYDLRGVRGLWSGEDLDALNREVVERARAGQMSEAR